VFLYGNLIQYSVQNLTNMILSCYIFELKRYLLILKHIPGCVPYEIHPKTKLIIFSRSRMRRLLYQFSHLVNLAMFVSMTYFTFAKNYDIFLRLFGSFVQVIYFTAIVARWNFSCSSKFINVFNQFLIFESKMKLKPNTTSNNQKIGLE